MQNRRSSARAAALALTLVLLPSLAAAGPAAGDGAPSLYTWALDLWQDLTHLLIHDADELGPGFDPNGATTSGDPGFGPDIDPNGTNPSDPDPSGDLGPAIDPSG